MRAVAVLVARLARGHEVLPPVLDPLDRRRDRPAPPASGTSLRAGRATFCPNPPPVSRMTTRMRCSGTPSRRGAEQPELVRHLGRSPDRHLAARARPFDDESARLHRHRGVGVLTERLGDDVRCRRRTRPRRRRPAARPSRRRRSRDPCLVDRDVGAFGRGVVDERRGAARSRRRPGRRRPRRRSGLGHDERDGVAHETHLVVGQRRTRALGDVRARSPCATAPCTPGSRRRRRGRRARRGVPRASLDVDGLDAGPGEGAAHEAGMEHPRAGDVVDERPRAGEQPGVLDPADAGTRVAPGAGGH